MRKLKWLTVLAVLLLTAYPVGELTRAIVAYNIVPLLAAEATTGGASYILTTWGSQVGLSTFYAELALIWGLYLVVPFLICAAMHLAWLMGGQRFG